MKKIFHFVALLLIFNEMSAQTPNSWTQVANYGGGTRDQMVSFTIGGMVYVGTGYDGTTDTEKKDFWQYNPTTNVWTQKANVGGLARKRAVGFSIGSKGYIGTGESSSATFMNDFWEYDPSTNAWTQKATFPGLARAYATGFVIGTQGYITTGINTHVATNQQFPNDMWAYSPATNTWTQKANFGGGGRFSASKGITINGKGYVGTGSISYNPHVYTQDFWEYDPSTDTWTSKASFPGAPRAWMPGFVIGTKGYFGTGAINYAIGSSDFYEFDPSLNIWTQKADFGGTSARVAAIGFSIGGVGYMGTGDINNNTGWTNDFWKYTPSSPCSTTTSIIVGSVTNPANGSDGAIDITIAGSDGPYTFDWAGPNYFSATTEDISALSAGTYYLTVTPATGCPAYQTVVLGGTNPTSPVPTLSQWGLIILSLLTISMVTVFMLGYQNALVPVGQSGSFAPISMVKSIPVNRSAWMKILAILLPIAIIGFFAVHYLIGTNGTLDFTGTLVSTFILSYIVHLFITKK